MSENTEVAELVFDKMEKYFDAAKTVIDQYGGDVSELALMALRIEALGELLPSIVMTLFFILTYKKFTDIIKDTNKKIKSEPYGIHDLKYIPIVIYGCFGVGVAISLIDIWAWAGLFYPELYAVHKFILN